MEDALIVNIGGGCARWAGTPKATLENKPYNIQLEKTFLVCPVHGATYLLHRWHTQDMGGREMSRVKHSIGDGARA